MPERKKERKKGTNGIGKNCQEKEKQKERKKEKERDK